MPVRTIPRSYRSITGRLAGVGTTPSVEHESLLERDCALLFQGDPTVASVEGQPVRIQFLAADAKGKPRLRSYIPDFLVRFHSCAAQPPLLIEVKYEQELRSNRDLYLPKIRAAHRYARERGWLFRIYTDRRIRGADQRLRNLKFLRSYRYEERDPAAAVLLSAVAAVGAIPARTLLERCASLDRKQRGHSLACLWWLVATHEIHADLDAAPLSLETIVRVAAPRRGNATFASSTPTIL